MPARHTSRQRALQILFQWDMRQEPVDNAIAAFYDTLFDHGDPGGEPTPKPDRDAFMESSGPRNCRAMPRPSISRIVEKSANWRIERMPVVDRNVLRLGIYEMIEAQTPPAIVIDEALELARQFSGEESVAFINGVLDAIRRDLEPETK